MKPGDTVILPPNPENPYFSGEYKLVKVLPRNILLIKRPTSRVVFAVYVADTEFISAPPTPYQGDEGDLAF